MTIRVLVVEDEAVAAEAHCAYVERVEGFSVAAVARTAAQAAEALGRGGIDLVLLDMRLPDAHGLDLLRHLRGRGHSCDVIAVTSVRDLDVVRRAMHFGVTHYVLKPFTFAAFRAKLLQYAAYVAGIEGVADGVVQAEVDRLFELRRAAGEASVLPKGLSGTTLEEVTQWVRGAAEPQSARAVADAVGTSRVTARRYLEHLVESGVVVRGERHGATGRPEVLYRWGTAG